MNNNILRTKKIKSRQNITQAAAHNFRVRHQHNINTNRSPANKILVNSLNVNIRNPSDLQEKLSSYYSSLGVKERIDNVLMMEFVVSASPEFFERKSMAQVEDWANHQVLFFKNKFGDQVKIVALHLDEKTPHLHIMIGTELKSVKKYKNQKGEFSKENWSLNARRYDPDFLIALHDEHADWNKKFKLRRGIRGGGKKHTPLKDFYQMVDQAMSADYKTEIQKSIDGLGTGFFKTISKSDIEEKFKPLINNFLKQNKLLRERFALDLKYWFKKMKDKEKQLEKELQEIEERKAVYKEAINKASDDAQLIKRLREQNAALAKKNDELIQKYGPRPVPKTAMAATVSRSPRSVTTYK
jgi:hypothetical protein